MGAPGSFQWAEDCVPRWAIGAARSCITHRCSGTTTRHSGAHITSTVYILPGGLESHILMGQDGYGEQGMGWEVRARAAPLVFWVCHGQLYH